MTLIIPPPHADEYAPYYALYIQCVPPLPLFTILRNQVSLLHTTLQNLPPEHAGYRFAPPAWSIKELVGHQTPP